MEILRRRQIDSILLPHENPMTLGGTNAYVVSACKDQITVVDPGTDDHQLLDRLVAGRHVELILLTHHHKDHSMGAEYLHNLSGAPVRAWRPELCAGASKLSDGEEFESSGVHMRVIHTPGHTSDSVCFLVPEETTHGTVLTGDTILGQGTTIIEHPDGLLADYLESLDNLEVLGLAQVLPGHGPSPGEGIAATVAEYRRRRLSRLTELEELLPNWVDSDVADIAAHLYPTKKHPRTRRAAERMILAQLRYMGDPRGIEGAKSS